MSGQGKIIRLLGVGFDSEDGHVRITKGKNYDVIMGSDKSHEFILELIDKIESEIESRGLNLGDITPDEFSQLVEAVL